MLDLNYVRENLDTVRAALTKRGMPALALDDFAQADAERRRVIAESDQLNAERNTASREIGALMKDGQREEAAARRKAVNELKERLKVELYKFARRFDLALWGILRGQGWRRAWALATCAAAGQSCSGEPGWSDAWTSPKGNQFGWYQAGESSIHRQCHAINKRRNN